MILALLAFTAGFAAAAPASYPEARTDPRFELFSVVQLLAGADQRYSSFHRHDIPYTRAAEAWFRPFSRHPVVEAYERFASRGIDTLFLSAYIFSLDEPPALEPLHPFEPANLADAGGIEAMEEFRVLLADFGRVSRFDAFYSETESFRRAMTDEVARQAVELDAKARLERYTGLPVRQSYTLIVSPFIEPVLSSTWVREEREGRRITSLYGPEEISGRSGFRLPTRLGGLWTEILIDQLRPAARPYKIKINRSKALYASLGGACAADWYDCVQRQVAFAVGARMLDLGGEHAAAQEWPIKYARIGLPHIGALAERLREFESNRDRYPTLLDFYPRLIEVFDALAQGAPIPVPFQGGIRAMLSDSSSRIVILPGNEAQGVGEAVRRLAKERWPDAEFLSDSDALTANLSGRTLLVIGTVSGNRWLARHLDDLQLPLHLGDSSITFDARPGETRALTFKGRLGLVSAAVNPVDPSRGLILYTANDPGVLASVIGAYDGPFDFAVLDKGVAVKLGRYEKTRRPWRLK